MFVPVNTESGSKRTIANADYDPYDRIRKHKQKGRVLDNINIENDEISLLDLLAVLWRWKWLIVVVTGLISVAAFAYVFIGKKMAPEKSFMPDLYTSTAFIRIRSDVGVARGVLASMLQQSNSGDAAELIGSGIVPYIAGSSLFLDTIADELHIAEKYKIKDFPKTKTRDIVKSLLKVKEKGRLISIAATHIDPKFAQKVALAAVNYYKKFFAEFGLDKKAQEKENLKKLLEQSFDKIKCLEQEVDNLENKISHSGEKQDGTLAMKQIKREIAIQEQVYEQLKVQYELLKVIIASENSAFQILAMPEIPERKSDPPRTKICIIAFAAGFFFSIFLAFLLNALQGILRDPAVRAKFRKEVRSL